MKPKIKNSFNDIFFFICYHLLAVSLSTALLLSLTQKIPLTNFDALLDAMVKSPFTHEAQAQTEATIVERIRGQVMIESEGKQPVLADEGQVISVGSTIITGDKSSALISFKGKYTWHVRLIPNTRFKLEELMKQRPEDKAENILFRLVQGGVILLLERMNQTVNMRVQTKSMTYGIRGTQFSVITDVAENSILTVKKGLVEVENFISMKKDLIAAGKVYFTNKLGLITVNQDKDILEVFDWDMEGPGLDDPDLELLRERAERHIAEAATGQPNGNQGTTTTLSPEQLREKLVQGMKQFSTEQTKLTEELDRLRTKLAKEEFNFSQEEKQVAADLNCLTTTNARCQLLMEKTLYLRGFPATHGTPQLRQSIINDLKAYLGERRETIASLQQEIIGLDALIRKRSEVLQAVDQEFKDGSDVTSLLRRLEDKDLKY